MTAKYLLKYDSDAHNFLMDESHRLSLRMTGRASIASILRAMIAAYQSSPEVRTVVRQHLAKANAQH
jgi:hypothetical protein